MAMRTCDDSDTERFDEWFGWVEDADGSGAERRARVGIPSSYPRLAATKIKDNVVRVPH